MGNSASKGGHTPRSFDTTFVKLDNDKLSYHPGDMVSGTIFIHLDQLDAFLLRGVELIVRGTEKVGWTERHTRTVSNGKQTTTVTYYTHPESCHDFFNQSFVVADRTTLRKFAYQAENNLQKRFCVPFRFQLPHLVPGSAYVTGLRGGASGGSHGDSFDGYAHCSYSVTSAVRVDLSEAQMQSEAQRSWWSKMTKKDACNDLLCEQQFTVLEVPQGPVRAAETRSAKKIKTCCCFSRGNAYTELSVGKNAYQFGDTISATAYLDNSQCRKGVKHITAKLRRIVALKTHVEEKSGGFFKRRPRHFASDESVLRDVDGAPLPQLGREQAVAEEQRLQAALQSGLVCAKQDKCQRKFELDLARELEAAFPPSCHGNLMQIFYRVEVQSKYGSCFTSNLECSTPVTIHSASLPHSLVNEAVPIAQQQAFMQANPAAIANAQVFYVSPDFGEKRLPPSFNPFARQLECPICLEGVDVDGGEPEWKCRKCHRDGRNPIHPKCAYSWMKACMDADGFGNRKPECPICREELDYKLDVKPLSAVVLGRKNKK